MSDELLAIVGVSIAVLAAIIGIVIVNKQEKEDDGEDQL